MTLMMRVCLSYTQLHSTNTLSNDYENQLTMTIKQFHQHI